MSEAEEKGLSFWEHLDELRKVLFRILIVVAVIMITVFLCKGILFDIVLAPSKSNFIIYRLFCKISDIFSIPAICPENFHVDLISTQLASQFFIHLSVSFYIGILLCFPYIIYQLFRFVSPALHENEKKYSSRVIISSSILFYLGVVLNYFIIFPLSFRFLGTYQVSEEIKNTITLSSYIDTLMMLSLMIGIMSELPIVSWLFAKLGFITDKFMRKYRRHAIVIILVIAAIITPTADAFTLLLVFFPIYILYELSIFIVKKSVKKDTVSTVNVEKESWEDPYRSS